MSPSVSLLGMKNACLLFIYLLVDFMSSAMVWCKYNRIQYKHKYYYSGINPVEFRGHSKSLDIQEVSIEVA